MGISLNVMMFLLLTTTAHCQEWTKATENTPNSFIFSGGTVDKQGRTLYVCRSSIKGEMASGKVLFSKGGIGQCKLPYRGKEIPTSNYEVIVSHPWGEYELKWSKPINVFGKIPSNALKVGSGTYVGRFKENKHYFLGKVKYGGIARLFFYNVGSRECFRKRGYQVLVQTARPIKSYEIIDVKYDMSKASQNLSPEYVTVAQKTVRNDSPFETSSTLSVVMSDSKTKEWSVTTGLEMYTGITTSVTAEIPSLGEATAELELGVTATFSYTHGESYSSSTEKSHDISVDLPPYSETLVAVIAKKAIIDIPYRATVRVVFEDGHTYVNQNVKGIYKEVHYTSFETSVEETSPESPISSGAASYLYFTVCIGVKAFAFCVWVLTIL